MSDNNRLWGQSLEWVFGCGTVLGGVTPGHRHSKSWGPYAPRGSLGGGARWCSTQWLERGRGTRGFLARDQGSISRRGMNSSGLITSASVLVVPEGRIEAAAKFASQLLVPAKGEGRGLSEWSMALVREPGRTGPALWITADGDASVFEEMVALFRSEIGIEHQVDFGGGYNADAANAEFDYCNVYAPDGTVAARLEGMVYLEEEPVPATLVEIGMRYGNAKQYRANRTPAIHIPTGDHRPLEPDEWNIDLDYARWE